LTLNVSAAESGPLNVAGRRYAGLETRSFPETPVCKEGAICLAYGYDQGMMLATSAPARIWLS
jgi:hypothetical protein